MKILNCIFLSILCLTAACHAQKPTIECVSARRGNTGHRGMIPAEERYKPLQGKDFFAIEIKATQDCTVEIVNLTVNDHTGQIRMKPVFDNNTPKKALKLGESYYLRVEKDENTPLDKSTSIKSEGVLTLKVNGKKVVLPIEQFKRIMPQ